MEDGAMLFYVNGNEPKCEIPNSLWWGGGGPVSSKSNYGVAFDKKNYSSMGFTL